MEQAPSSQDVSDTRSRGDTFQSPREGLNRQVSVLSLSLFDTILVFINSALLVSGISEVLFKRARSIAKQHDELSATLSEGFDPKVAKRVGELAPIVKVLKDWDKANNVRQLRETGKEKNTEQPRLTHPEYRRIGITT